MKLLLRLGVFFLVLIVDVRVRAEEVVILSLASEVMQEPVNCLEGAQKCAVKTEGREKFIVAVNKNTVTLGPDTLIVRQNDSSINLLYGEIWLKTISESKVETEFGSLVTFQEGARSSVWMTKTKERLLIRVGEGSVVISPRGSLSTYRLSAGYEIWLGRVQASGVAQVSAPRAIEVSEHLNQWARLFSGSKSEFALEVKKFREVWQEAVQRSAETYQKQIDREIAMVKQEKERKEKQQRLHERENLEIRKMFREKNYFDLNEP